MSYIYNRGWYFCPKCNNPFWHGNSYIFKVCYDCLPKNDKEGWFFKFENGLYFKKLKERESIPLSNKIKYVENWKKRRDGWSEIAIKQENKKLENRIEFAKK